ncbi:glycosyltransferase [Polaribacter sp.]|nr:glycosyltransferase [Polaribacter sp.]
MQPKFSIIIPVFNAEKHIEMCLNSLLDQTLDAIEIIAVNDGSTDQSLTILYELASKDSRLKVFTQQNAGPSVARNVGISNSIGAYISFVDADDWLEKNAYECLETQIEKNHQPDIVMFNTFTNDSIKNKPFLSNKFYQKEDIKKSIYPRLIESLNPSNGSTLRTSVWLRVFKRELIFDKIWFEKDLRNNEDLVFCFSTTIKAKSFLYLGNSYLYHNCMTTGSISRGYMKDAFNTMKPLFNVLTAASTKCKDYEFYEQIKARVFRTFIFCCENEFLPENKKSLRAKYKYIKELVSSEDFIDHLFGFKHSNEKAKKIYAFCFKNKMIIPILFLANYRVKNRIKKIRYV